MLADYGASVLRIDRPNAGSSDQSTRRKSSITLHLRNAASHSVLLSVLAKADILIDPYRPGVLERLGLSPSEVLLKYNPRLIVARMTAFRRDGKYKDMAGHDINYIAVSGVLSSLGRAGEPPYAPGNIIGDFAGGGAMCFMGILLALLSRTRQDAARRPRAEHVRRAVRFMTRMRPRIKASISPLERWNPNFLRSSRDSGSVRRNFSRDDRENWPVLRAAFAKRFKEKTRAEWESIFDGTDRCATPVLEQDELEQGGFEQLACRLEAWLGWKEGREYDVRSDGALIKTGEEGKANGRGHRALDSVIGHRICIKVTYLLLVKKGKKREKS
uniref:Nuclease O n=1 Tax=Aspergillus oryzae TaxID=5062 RepID=P78582_ASPOZ|nr:nuclease O [Aspergillus oryzae]